MDDERYKNMEKLVGEFQSGIGKKLQRYLVLKSWWATNYVSLAAALPRAQVVVGHQLREFISLYLHV